MLMIEFEDPYSPYCAVRAEAEVTERELWAAADHAPRAMGDTLRTPERPLTVELARETMKYMVRILEGQEVRV